MSGLSILGGGPAGLGLAHYAHRAGLAFTLYERSADLGGMCRTLQRGAHRFDVGAHRYHDRDAEVTADLRALLGESLRPVRAPSQIWTRGRFVDFPPTPLNAISSFGLAGAARIGLDLVDAMRRPPNVVSFQDYAHRRYGATLARELLLNYSEKLWGLPADRLSPDVATQRLQGLSLRTLFVELLRPARKTAHIDGEFLYPRRGYGEITERLAASVPSTALRTSHEVTGFDLDGRTIARIHFRDRAPSTVRGRIVSTLPLSLIARLLGDALPIAAREVASRLRFRQLRLVFVRLAQSRVSKNASIYLPEANLCVSRLYEPKNRSPEMSPAHETSLVAEIPCFAEDALARTPDDALAARVIDEIASIGLIEKSRVIEWQHVLAPAAYPVYSLGYEQDARHVLRALTAIENLDTLGRAGTFFYSHLHDQLRLARNYVEASGHAS